MIRPFIKWVLRLRLWLPERLRPGELQTTLLWAGGVGFMGAVSSVVFREGIRGAQWLLTRHNGGLVQIAESLPWWQRLLIPCLGGLIAGLVIHFGMRLAKGQSSTDYMEAVSLGDGMIRVRSTLIKSLSSLMTIASGGSIGREGPMVQLSSMFASLLGRTIHFPTSRLRLLVACGAAAGIASAYNAPIAGSLFVAEVILGSIAMESFGPLIFSSVIATVTVRQFLGEHPTYDIPPFHLNSNWELIPYLLLGLLAGVAAPWFMRLLWTSESIFSKLRIPVYVKMSLGGMMVGILSIFKPAVWGNGYSVVNSILLTDVLWQALLILLVVKLLATASTVGSGATGGVFTPTLFMGAAMGGLWGGIIHHLFPGIAPAASAYALVGMGCFLAGTTHAPLMAILMLFEMTLDYAIVLPLMLACVTAYYTSTSIEKRSIYTKSHGRKRGRYSNISVEQIPLRDLMHANPVRVLANAKFSAIAESFATNRFHYLYVTDETNRFLGAISLHDIKPYLYNPDLANVIIAQELLREQFPVITEDATLLQALDMFFKHDGERLPIIKDQQGRELIGTVSKGDLLLTLAHGR